MLSSACGEGARSLPGVEQVCAWPTRSEPILSRLRLEGWKDVLSRGEMDTVSRKSDLMAAALKVSGLLALFLLGVLPGMSTSSAASLVSTKMVNATSSRTVAIPRGWRTYSYASALISVPADWAVERNDPCPHSVATGLLVLGSPPGYDCPEEGPPENHLELTAEFMTTGPQRSPSAIENINGLQVDIFASTSKELVGDVPSLGLEISATGSDSRRMLDTLQPLQAVSIPSMCAKAAIHEDLGAIDRQLGVRRWTKAAPVLWDGSAAVPTPPPDFSLSYPQFQGLTASGLQVFEHLTSDTGAAAFYSASLEPSRRLTISRGRCRGQIAGIETLRGSVADTVLGPPWQMIAVLEPGWNGGELFFRGDCPGNVQPASTMAPCDTVAVYFVDNSMNPSDATASASALFH